MYRKLSMYLLAALLLLLPVSAAFGGKAQAASSSRIAVIKQLSGDVQVQKAGGSKQFKAFAKLSLNQGDKLITGSKGSAVLQFSNGTSEDDKFTVGENATLTFSKLSDKKGTVTKVSMLKGTAWVDVKSIKSQEDDFKLETPTAIMGVRGTAFFARVNPATGGTNTAVMSGVVRFTSENMEQTGSGSGESLGSTGASGSKTIDLYPTQQISLEPTSGPDLRELTTLVDIEEIVKNASPEVIEAILRSKAKIDEENRQTIEKFKQTGLPPELPQSLDKFTQNAEELLGVIAKQAIKQKKIDEQQVKKIEEQEKTSFNLDKDQLSQLDQKEKAKLEKARQLAEEAAKKKATEEAAKLKELADKINAAALKAIEAAKLAQDEANRLAAEAAKRKAEEELLKKLNEQQKQQYQQDKANNQGSTTAPNTNTNNLPSNANLGSLSISGAALSPSFNAAVTAYRASVTSDKTSVVVGASVQESGASFTINGQVPGGGQRTVSLAYGDNEITVLVTAQNGSTQAYKVTVTRQLLNNVSVVFAGQSGIDIDFNSTNAPAPLSIPSGSSNLTLVVPVTGPEIDIAVNGQNVEPIPMFTAARTLLPDQIAWRYVIPLAQASNEIEIKATIDGVVKSYKLFANRTMSSDAAVQSVSATSEDGTMAYEVRATGGNSWTVKVPADVTTIKLKINAINPDAKILMGANEFASGTVIPYTIINTTVPFQVRAADGTVPEVFNSISISRLPSSDASLSGLVLSHGTLSPAFASATTNYTANVGNAVESITVKPTASNGNATVAVNDTTVQSGNQSELIPLRVGTNQITVEVMAQNGSRQKYTIIITRAGDTPPHLTSWSAHTSEGDVLTWIYSVQWGDGIPLDTYAATVPNRDTDQVELTLNFDESMYDYAVIYPSQGEEIEFFNGQPKSLPLQDGEISRYELYMYKNGQSDENIRDVLKIRKGVSDFSSAMTALDVEDQDENTYSVLPWSADKEYVLYADADAESLSFDSYDYRNGLTIKDANDDPFENAAFDIPLDPGDTLLNVHIADEFSEEVFKLRVVKTPLSPSLKLSRLTVEGSDVWFNPLTRSYVYTAAKGTSTVTLHVEALDGANIEHIVVDGREVPVDGGEFTLGVPDEGERVAGIVVESGGERYVHRLSVQAFPSVVGLAGLTFRQGSTADGPVIRPGYDGKAGEGSGSIYAVVGENVSTVRLELQSDKANIQVSGNLQIENKGGGVWILWPKQGVNAIHISVEPENYNYSDIHVDLIRGAMPLEDLDITSAEGYETVSYEKTGPQQYYAATQMERISLYPSMRDYHGQFEIWAHGSKLASKYDPISLAEGWNDDIYIHTYDYHGGIVNIYQVVVWQGAGDPSEIGIDWNLRDEFANAATLVENNRGVIGPESSYATITPVVTGGQIERVYVDGTESFQGEAVGSYDITLGELNDGESSSAEVSLIVRIPGNKLVPKKLKLVRGVMADDAVMFAPAGETTSVGLQIHLPAGIAATPTIQVTQQPAYGSYEITESTLSYTPNEGFVGTDTIFFQVSYTYNEEGAEPRVIKSEPAAVEIKVTDISLHSNSVDETSPAGIFVGQLTVPDPSAFAGAVSFELVEGPGDDHNSLFMIDEEGRLKVGSEITGAQPEVLFVRVRAYDAVGNSVEKPLTIFHLSMELLMYSIYGGSSDTGAVAYRYAGGDYWVQYNTSAEQIENTSNFRVVIKTGEADWNVSINGNEFVRTEDVGGDYRYTLSVEKPEPGSSVDYPIVMENAAGNRYEFTFHYYQGPIPAELDGSSSNEGLRPAIEADGESYEVHKGVADWDATVSPDTEQLELSAVLAEGVRMTIYDDYGRSVGQEDNTAGVGALTATFDLFKFGSQQNYYVHASNGSGTIMYPLRIYYEPLPKLTSLRLWYTAGDGYRSVPISSEMSVEIDEHLVPEVPPYLPLGIEAIAKPDQIVRVYRANGSDWIQMESQNVTLHDNTQMLLYPFTYYEPYQSFKIEVDTSDGKTKDYYLALMRPGYDESA